MNKSARDEVYGALNGPVRYIRAYLYIYYYNATAVYIYCIIKLLFMILPIIAKNQFKMAHLCNF